MRYTVARTFVLVLGLLTVLFSLDAAMMADVELSFLLAIGVIGVGYLLAMIWLAGRVLHGAPRERHTSAVALDIVGALPLAVLVPAIPLVGGAHIAAAGGGATAWLLFVLLWTWLAVNSREPLRAPRHAGHFPAPLQSSPSVRQRIRFHRKKYEED
jgi:hypothetical protein